MPTKAQLEEKIKKMESALLVKDMRILAIQNEMDTLKAKYPVDTTYKGSLIDRIQELENRETELEKECSTLEEKLNESENELYERTSEVYNVLADLPHSRPTCTKNYAMNPWDCKACEAIKSAEGR